MSDQTSDMRCCPGKWKHDPDCVPCRFCFAGTRRYRGDVPICSDCQQNQAWDDYQAAVAKREASR